MEPSEIEAGKCYFAKTGSRGKVRRVRAILPDGRVQYEQRPASRTTGWGVGGMLGVTVFASMAEREVACDWVIVQEEK